MIKTKRFKQLALSTLTAFSDLAKHDIEMLLALNELFTLNTDKSKTIKFVLMTSVGETRLSDSTRRYKK